MDRFSSIFGQILHLFSKREFFENVYATQAERGAKGSVNEHRPRQLYEKTFYPEFPEICNDGRR